ncbi:hypothetical protein [Candidatus Clostridium stratigraminis]|uniref:DUF4367 domain-containing protein n=1 Tax=Candidatus Clostridium stratigraminis TaxID=3381661 RepID=A0ABW8T9P7_9CLOT
MKLFIKRLSIVLVIYTVIISVAILNPNQKEFNKTFNNSFVTTDFKTMSKNSTIEINAKLYKRFSLKHFNSDKILDGYITIDNKKYALFGYDLGTSTNNLLFGDVKEKSTDITPIYILYMFDNLNSIYLSGFDNKQHIAAPANTIDDFEILHRKINRK